MNFDSFSKAHLLKCGYERKRIEEHLIARLSNLLVIEKLSVDKFTSFFLNHALSIVKFDRKISFDMKENRSLVFR